MAVEYYFGGQETAGAGSKATIWRSEIGSGVFTKVHTGLRDSFFSGFTLDSSGSVHACGGGQPLTWGEAVYAQYDGASWTNFDVFNAAWNNKLSNVYPYSDTEVYFSGSRLWTPEKGALYQYNPSDGTHSMRWTSNSPANHVHYTPGGQYNWWPIWVNNIGDVYHAGNIDNTLWSSTWGLHHIGWDSLTPVYIVCGGSRYYLRDTGGYQAMNGSPTNGGFVGSFSYVAEDDIWATYQLGAVGRVYHWDGTIWTLKHSGGPLSRISADAAGNVVVGGWTKLFESQNAGDSWTEQTANMPGGNVDPGVFLLPDTTPPELSPTSPTNLATDVGISSLISFNLTDDVALASSWTVDIDRGDGWELALTYSNGTATFTNDFNDSLSSVTAISGGFSVVLDPVAILPYSYTVQVRATAQDTSGNDVVLV
jgi:hypothetical protein